MAVVRVEISWPIESHRNHNMITPQMPCTNLSNKLVPKKYDAVKLLTGEVSTRS